MRYDFDTVYEDQFSYIIDNQKYIFKATLFNPDGDNLTLTKSQVKELKLYDNIFQPWIKGEIIIDNTEQALERFRTNPVDQELKPGSKEIQGYTTRGDGRDFIRIEIVPLNTTDQGYDENSDEFNKLFGLRYFFSISDEETVDVNNVECRRYIINDYDLEILHERKTFFSSSQLVDTTESVTDLNNKNRESFTGDCLKKILALGLNGDDVVKLEENPDTGEYVSPKFESGSSRIFYSSPANASAYYDLMYILKRHVGGSDKQDFSFLKKQNFSGEYTLQSAATLFSKAFVQSRNTGGELFVENFTITGSSKEDTNIIETEKKSPDASLEFGEKSEILNYKFFNTPGKLYKEKIKTEAVHSYDFKNKKFNVDIFDSNAIAAKTKFSELYVTPLKGKNGKPAPNLPLTEMQKQNLTFNNIFSEYGDNSDIRKSYGINKLLRNALVTNMGVEIIVKGQTLRRSGTFFSLDRAGDYIDNTFDNKLLGIYFIAEVQHEFVNDTEYFNKIIGIKTYHYEDPKFREDMI